MLLSQTQHKKTPKDQKKKLYIRVEVGNPEGVKESQEQTKKSETIPTPNVMTPTKPPGYTTITDMQKTSC